MFLGHPLSLERAIDLKLLLTYKLLHFQIVSSNLQRSVHPQPPFLCVAAAGAEDTEEVLTSLAVAFMSEDPRLQVITEKTI